MPLPPPDVKIKPWPLGTLSKLYHSVKSSVPNTNLKNISLDVVACVPRTEKDDLKLDASLDYMVKLSRKEKRKFPKLSKLFPKL